MKRAASPLPETAAGHCHRGNALRELGQLEDALVSYRRAIEIKPGWAMAHNNLANALEELGQLDDAVASYRVANALLPAHPDIKCNLGHVLLKAGHVREAAVCFVEVLQTLPDCLDAVFGFGLASRLLGDLSQAVACYRQALALRLLQPTQALAQPPRESFNRPENEALMWRTLAQLAEAGVHAFATSGTLLGLEREGHLLPFDKDLDFGLPFVEHNAARACLLQHGWKEHAHNFGLVNPRAYQHTATGLSLDVLGYVVENGTGITLGGFWLKKAQPGWNRVTENPLIQLNSVVGPHGVVWSLANPHAWLESMYGDWRAPDPDFDSTIAAKNLRGFSLLTQYYAFSRIFGSWNRGRLDKALATTRHSLSHLPNDDLLLQVEMHLSAALGKTMDLSVG